MEPILITRHCGENMESQFPPSYGQKASMNRRFFNFVLDEIVFQVVMFFLVNPFIGSFFTDPVKIDLWINLLFSFLIFFLFYFGFEAIFQRTPGKMITGTKVIMEDGSKPNPGTIALRTLIRFVPFEVISIYSGQDQSKANTLWHDRWTGTRVVRKVDPAKDLANSEVLQVPPVYEPSSKSTAKRLSMKMDIVALGVITFTIGGTLLLTSFQSLLFDGQLGQRIWGVFFTLGIGFLITGLSIFGIVILARNLKKHK
jgi:uncharacterized RDD family membrane protein YckC